MSKSFDENIVFVSYYVFSFVPVPQALQTSRGPEKHIILRITLCPQNNHNPRETWNPTLSISPLFIR